MKMKIENEKLITDGDKVKILPFGTTIGKAIKNIIKEKNTQDSILVGDIGDIIRKYETWKEILPSVQPVYTVRCNDSPIVLQILSALDNGFNCYSKTEMERLMEYGVGGDRMIYGAPLKTGTQIKSSSVLGVDLLVIESVGDLRKIKAYHQNPKLILRLKTPFPNGFDSDFPEENDMEEIPHKEQPQSEYEQENIDKINNKMTSILTSASDLGLDVVGFWFESLDFGTKGNEDRIKEWINGIIESARSLGHGIRIINLGDGLKETSDLEKVSSLASALDFDSLTLMAESGPFLVSSGFTLSTRIQGSRLKSERMDLLGGEREPPPRQVLYLSEGVYGYVFGKLLTGTKLGQDSRPRPLLVSSKSLCPTWRLTDIIGPTSDTLDVIEEDRSLPPLETGDWIKFDSIGDFHIPTGLLTEVSEAVEGPSVHYLVEEKEWFRIKGLHPNLLDVFESAEKEEEITEEKEKKESNNAEAVGKERKKRGVGGGGRRGRNNPSQKRRVSSDGGESKGADRSRMRTISPEGDPSRKGFKASPKKTD